MPSAAVLQNTTFLIMTGFGQQAWPFKHLPQRTGRKVKECNKMPSILQTSYKFQFFTKMLFHSMFNYVDAQVVPCDTKFD